MANASGTGAVRLFHTALQELPDGNMILRGVLDPKTLENIGVAPYQREVLPLSSLSALVKGFRFGRIPDIELGMRGDNFKTRTEDDGSDTVTLVDAAYVIDGYQRISAAKHYMLQPAIPHPPHLGAAVHLGTTEEWERERFRILNVDRNKVSPNVLLRNHGANLAGIDMLIQLTTGSDFVVAGRVCWQNRMTREHLLGGLGFCKTIGTLHQRFGPGRGSNVDELARGLDTIVRNVGHAVVRANAVTFFDVMEECFGLKRVTYREGAPYLKYTFLWAVADLFATFENAFWEETRLVVNKDWRKKLAQFPYSDPQVVQLAATSGPSRDILRHMLIRHLNSGRRSNRLAEIEELSAE